MEIYLNIEARVKGKTGFYSFPPSLWVSMDLSSVLVPSDLCFKCTSYIDELQCILPKISSRQKTFFFFLVFHLVQG